MFKRLSKRKDIELGEFEILINEVFYMEMIKMKPTVDKWSQIIDKLFYNIVKSFYEKILKQIYNFAN